MKFPSRQVAKRIWYILFGLFMAEAAGLFVIAPYWNGGAIVGGIHALACLAAGTGVTFLLLATTDPGTAFSTRANRYLFAVLGGTAFNLVLTWGLWAVGYPIANGTVRRGLMAENYWLGPAVLAYSVIVWLIYRAGLNKESQIAKH